MDGFLEFLLWTHIYLPIGIPVGLCGIYCLLVLIQLIVMRFQHKDFISPDV